MTHAQTIKNSYNSASKQKPSTAVPQIYPPTEKWLGDWELLWKLLNCLDRLQQLSEFRKLWFDLCIILLEQIKLTQTPPFKTPAEGKWLHLQRVCQGQPSRWAHSSLASYALGIKSFTMCNSDLLRRLVFWQATPCFVLIRMRNEFFRPLKQVFGNLFFDYSEYLNCMSIYVCLEFK